MQMKWVTWSSSVIRQKGESQNACFKKTNHAKFSGKRTCVRKHMSTWTRKQENTQSTSSCAWHAHVLGVLTCLVCLRTCVRTCYDEMFYFRACLRTWCAFLSYLLYILILEFKNSCSKTFVCFVKLNIFLIYILIPTYKTIWNQFKGSRKVNRYIM